MILSVLDRKWREHLYEMDYLRDGIGLRAMAQRDPLIEYQREGFDLFNAMMDAIKEETVGYLFNVEVQVNPPVSEEAAAAVEELADATAVAGDRGPRRGRGGRSPGGARQVERRPPRSSPRAWGPRVRSTWSTAPRARPAA